MRCLPRFLDQRSAPIAWKSLWPREPLHRNQQGGAGEREMDGREPVAAPLPHPQRAKEQKQVDGREQDEQDDQATFPSSTSHSVEDELGIASVRARVCQTGEK